ncbi:NAD-dependent epimerase/dehydratase family protein [uncultured Hymenobacter sp.]|uniref:NAD-dependent epimerase/dehydratase family protein n=1 Tax=uncultured Hymenobacter sp. TaxID=170016 RepID=UPI0035CBAA85
MNISGPVLVTGAAGRLGREIVLLLRTRGYKVVGADLLPSTTTDLLLDIREAAAVQRAVRGVGAILHTAALHGRHYELHYPRAEFVETNIGGTLNLLEAGCQHGVGKFIYTSTTSIYGQAMVHPEQAVWVEETLRPEPRDIYDITKQAAEALCRDFFGQEGLETVVLRVSRFLPEPPNLAANNRLYRGLDERDGALGHLLALEHRFSEFEVFNISAGSPFQRDDVGRLKHSPRQVIDQRLPQAAVIYEQLGWQFPASIDQVYSIEKARQQLGYEPRYTAERLLHEAVQRG